MKICLLFILLHILCNGETLENIGSMHAEDWINNLNLLSSLPEKYQIVYPEQIKRSETKDLSTRRSDQKDGKALHYHRTSMQLSMFGKRYRLRLELNKYLVSSKMKQKFHIDEQTQEITEVPHVENCYYQGHVRKDTRTRVALATCDGLRGVMHLHNESIVIIPLPKVVEENSEQDVLDAIKTIDIAMVTDLIALREMNCSSKDAVPRVLALLNVVDMYLRPLRIRLRASFLEIWSEREEFQVQGRVRAALTGMLMHAERRMRSVDFDALLFMTGSEFESPQQMGMAIPGSVCSRRSIAVLRMAPRNNMEATAVVAAHELLLVLGVQVDEHHACACADLHGCIMKQNLIRPLDPLLPRYASSCTVADLRSLLMAGLGACLFDDDEFQVGFKSQCGNGRLERGEECDCGNAQQCDLDPCCDRRTCLLQSWASCRWGSCCHNCTVRATSHVCRTPATECDVPEFCDGVTGTCPSDNTYQDGQACRGDEGICYQGACNTVESQCKVIWGQEARAAEAHCAQTFNPTGGFNGHCGRVAGKWLPCLPEHALCGLLHCAGGSDKPIITDSAANQTHISSMIYSQGQKYQCKIYNSAEKEFRGLVADGTKCGNGKICVNHACVSAQLGIHQTCPRGYKNKTCSGRGVCTSDTSCFCDKGFLGADCAMGKAVSTSPASTALPYSISVASTSHAAQNATVAVEGSNKQNFAEEGPSTLWLIVVLTCVAGAACFILIFCMICYRRRSPTRYSIVSKKTLLANQLLFMDKSGYGSGEENTNRLISFGNMPSYREEKMQQRQKRKQHHQHSDQSREGSVYSERGNPDIRPAKFQTEPPERGILKKHREQDIRHGLMDLHDIPFITPEEEDDVYDQLQPTIADDENVDNEEIACLAEDDLEIQPDTDSRSSSSLEKDYLNSGDRFVQPKDPVWTTPSASAKSCYVRESSSSPMLQSCSTGSTENVSRKVKRLRNLDDLIRQIDEQVNQFTALQQRSPSSPRAAMALLSPSGESDEQRSSEPEVDRHFPRGSLYRQTDSLKLVTSANTQVLMSPHNHEQIEMKPVRKRRITTSSCGSQTDANNPQSSRISSPSVSIDSCAETETTQLDAPSGSCSPACSHKVVQALGHSASRDHNTDCFHHNSADRSRTDSAKHPHVPKPGNNDSRVHSLPVPYRGASRSMTSPPTSSQASPLSPERDPMLTQCGSLSKSGGSVSIDGQSQSEGYHSDRAELEEQEKNSAMKEVSSGDECTEAAENNQNEN